MNDRNPSVLVVEDDAAISRALAIALESRGYDVEVAMTGEAALSAVTMSVPDVVLLDLGLPDVDGVEVVRRLRRWMSNPILVLTADGNDDRKVAALDSGADDYVVKPFSTPELLARIRVALRHRQVLAAVVDDHVERVGETWVDVGAHCAGVGRVSLELTRKEFLLLAVLVRNVDKVLTHDVLLEQVWGSGHALPTLRTHVTQLRRKLRDAGSHVDVVSEPGIGYRLVNSTG